MSLLLPVLYALSSDTNRAVPSSPKFTMPGPHKYTLHYFPFRGLGEVTRQLFVLADVEYTDRRVPMTEWGSVQDRMPFHQLPVLEIDEQRKLPQSFAIARYLAREFGFAGRDPFECAYVDALGDQFKDYFHEIKPLFLSFKEEDPELRKSSRMVGETARDKFYAFIERQLKENGTGYLVGIGLTWIDLVIADHVATLEAFEPDFFADFPNVKAHRSKIQSIPKLAKWLANRPEAEF